MQKRPPVYYLTKKPDPRAEYKSYYLKDVHEPIIDRATWEKAQVILQRREQDRQAGIERKRADAHFLYGKLFCGQCGAPYKRRTFNECRARGGGSYKVWCCKERGKGKRGNGCTNPILREDALLEMVVRQLGTAPFDEAVFMSRVDKITVQADGEIAIQCFEEAV